MATLITTTYRLTNGEATVSVFAPSSGIRCECGSGAGYLETVTSDAGRTLGALEWTCSACGAGNREVLTGAHVGQAFDAMRA